MSQAVRTILQSHPHTPPVTTYYTTLHKWAVDYSFGAELQGMTGRELLDQDAIVFRIAFHQSQFGFQTAPGQTLDIVHMHDEVMDGVRPLLLNTKHLIVEEDIATRATISPVWRTVLRTFPNIVSMRMFVSNTFRFEDPNQQLHFIVTEMLSSSDCCKQLAELDVVWKVNNSRIFMVSKSFVDSLVKSLAERWEAGCGLGTLFIDGNLMSGNGRAEQLSDTVGQLVCVNHDLTPWRRRLS